MSGEARGAGARRPTRPRPDRTLLWGVVLLLLAAPAALLLLVLVGWGLTLAGLDPATPEGAARARSLNGLFLALAGLPLVASALLGVRAWRRRRRAGGLVLAAVAVVALAAFLAGPALL